MDEAKTEQKRELTYGEKSVGLTFNPGNNDAVSRIKKECAAAIDTLNNIREANPNPDVKRMASIAITELQTAQMWGVKAATWTAS